MSAIVRAPSRAAWIEAVRARYEPELLTYAKRLVASPDQVEDLVQDVFVRLCQQDPAKIGNHVGPWLFTVCKRAAIDRTRRARHRHSVDPEAAERHPGLGDPPWLTVASDEQRQRLRAAITDLPDRHRQVLLLRYFQDQSYRAISDTTGETIHMVGYLLHQAILILRDALAE